MRQKFTGYQKDEESGLDFAEARMYENRHGRFTAIDPLLASGKSANPQSFNRYVYVMNNPLLLTDPNGLQAGTATGKVYKKGRNYAIFRGGPLDGYKRVTRTVNTTTMINGVEHYATVRPNGWTIGNRVDGAHFESPTQAASSQRSDISVVAGAAVQGVKDGFIGIGKGIVNAPGAVLNGLTWLTLNLGIGSVYFQGSNPLEVPHLFSYGDNSLQASYGSAGTFGVTTGAGFAFSAISSGSSFSSVVPETQVFRFSQSFVRSDGMFSTEGMFAGRSIPSVANDLRLGTVSPSEVPVGYVTRNGINLIDNTRSSIALQEAGIPMNQWNLVNRTGKPFFENSVTTKLANNGLPNTGTNSVRFGNCFFNCQ